MFYLNAHADLMPRLKNRPPARSGAARAILESGLELIGLGWRAYTTPEYEYWRRNGIKVFSAPAIRRRPELIQNAVAALPERVYLCLDLDVLDQALVPDLETAEPDGLSLAMVETALARLFGQRLVLGVELSGLEHGSTRPPKGAMANRLVDLIWDLRERRSACRDRSTNDNQAIKPNLMSPYA